MMYDDLYIFGICIHLCRCGLQSHAQDWQYLHSQDISVLQGVLVGW